MKKARMEKEALMAALAFYEEIARKEAARYEKEADASREKGDRFLTGYYQGGRQVDLFYADIFRRLQGLESGQE